MSDDTHDTRDTRDGSTRRRATDRAGSGDGRNRAVILASGGMDSATAAALARNRGYDLHLLHCSYGQRTETREHRCASAQADRFDAADFLRLRTDHLSKIGGSSLTDEGRDVAEADLDSAEIPTSYVPFRNANLLSMAVSYAEANGCDAVFTGAHSEDFSGYPDCRPEFFEAFEAMVEVGTKPGTDVDVEAPFAEWSKTEIVERGAELGVPFEHTWSCYRDESPACGTCDACAFRLQAFQRVGIRDPIEYAERPDYTDQ